MSLALCPQVVSQAPQHFRSSVTASNCDGYFTRQASICSLISLDYGANSHQFVNTDGSLASRDPTFLSPREVSRVQLPGASRYHYVSIELLVVVTTICLDRTIFDSTTCL